MKGNSFQSKKILLLILLSGLYSWAVVAQTASEFRDRGMSAYAFSGDYLRAIDDLTTAIALDQKEHGAFYFRGLCYHKLGRYAEAIADFNNALSYAPNEVKGMYFNARGLTKHALFDFRGAVIDYTDCLNLNPKNSEALYNRATALAMLDKYEMAIEDLNASISLQPRNKKAFRERGLVKGRYLEDHFGAISDFTKAINLDDGYADAYFNRGIAKLIVGLKEDGCLDLSKAGERGYHEAYQKIKDFCQ